MRILLLRIHLTLTQICFDAQMHLTNDLDASVDINHHKFESNRNETKRGEGEGGGDEGLYHIFIHQLYVDRLS